MEKLDPALRGLLILISTPAGAQVHAPDPIPAAQGAVQSIALNAGTSVALKMSEALTIEGKKLRVGQQFQPKVEDPVTVNGYIVIPRQQPGHRRNQPGSQ